MPKARDAVVPGPRGASYGLEPLVVDGEVGPVVGAGSNRSALDAVVDGVE